MHVTSTVSSEERKGADVVVVPVWYDKKQAVLACKGKEFQALVEFPLHSGDFHGKEGETLLLYRGGSKEKRVLLVGLGGTGSCLPDSLRRAYAAAVKALRAKKIKSAHFLFPSMELMSREVICKAVIEGVLLSNYAFDALKGESERATTIDKVCFCGLDKEENSLLKRAQTVVQSVHFVRDLVSRNADDVNSETLVKIAKDLAKEHAQIKATILDKKHLEKEKLGLILAVGQGAELSPVLILLEYKGDPRSKEVTALVGKGITYDTGGLNIKTSGMETMKCDMAGSAAVLGTLQAAAELKLKKNLLCVLAVAENAIGPKSYKPGDVFRSYCGKTVEISNTDAEGRLVLADALSYIQKNHAPDRIIDLATLTGGIVVAIGEEATGLFCNDEELCLALEKAGERTHERVWRMPLYPEYKELLKSSIADIKNSGARKASPCQGAIFLSEFIGKKMPWAHLDIAGTAYLSELKGYHPTYATGVGVRLLIDFLEHLDDGK
ncbi:MAG: leucyl aminopeptidase [Verrucomicrobia bacterium]|nr:leucyl aminopeptidase [Verrucomicrobiota bacterium]